MFSVCSGKISACKQNLSAGSASTRSHFSFFRGSAAIFDSNILWNWPETSEKSVSPYPKLHHYLQISCQIPDTFSQCISLPLWLWHPKIFFSFPDLQTQIAAAVGDKAHFFNLCSPGASKGENSGKNSIYWASVLKAAAHKNPYGKIHLHVETEPVHTAKEGFP